MSEIILCQFVEVGAWCVCPEAKCGRRILRADVVDQDCAKLRAWCKSDPEWTVQMNRLSLMSNEEREKYLAEMRAAGETVEPGLLRAGWNYSKALANWTAAGKPTRSPDRIAEILVICEACPFYTTDGNRPRCKKCGCSVNNLPGGTKNKIAMATEACPLNPPKWEAEAS